MARPKVPLIDRDDAITKALELIDRDGLDAFSLRGLAGQLGVNAASLYHHFSDKQAILDGVRLRIALGSGLSAPDRADDTWQDRLRGSALVYRELLVQHPNVAPLMSPNAFERPYGIQLREHVAARLVQQGVPDDLIHAIIDSVELLAYASSLLNPNQLPIRDRVEIGPDDRAPSLAIAIEAAPTTAQEVFEDQLDALVVGWTAVCEARR